MRYEITSPDGKRFEVTAPDDASQEEVLAYAQKQFAPKQPEKPISAMDGMSGGEKFLVGMGKGFKDVGRGIGQRLGMVTPEEVAESRKYDQPLMDTTEGMVGNFAGNVAALAPALAIPGANTIAGASLVGGLSGLAQPTTKDESATTNALTGLALGGAGQYGVGKLAQFAGNRLASKEASGAAAKALNSKKDEAIREAVETGYKTIPSVSNGPLAGRVVEGLTGKEKAKQLASVQNQNLTDTLARRAFGLTPDVPLSQDTMKAVRAEAVATGYDPVRAVPRMATDDVFRQTVSNLTSRADNAAKDFGAVVQSDIKPFADDLAKVQSFTGDSAVDAISVLREKASDAYSSGNKTLGKAYRKAAEAIEAQVDRSLAKSGKDGASLLKNYREARTKMAQTFDVEKALNEGQGKIDARVLGKLFNKSPDRLSGELRTIGKSAAAMPDVMALPKDGWSNPVTALDSGIAAFGGILAGNPAPLAYPAIRAGARYGLMSGPGQKMLTTPSYDPGMMMRMSPKLLEELKKAGGAGLLAPSIYAAQQ